MKNYIINPELLASATYIYNDLFVKAFWSTRGQFNSKGKECVTIEIASGEHMGKWSQAEITNLVPLNQENLN
jgi:hypothetical protein